MVFLPPNKLSIIGRCIAILVLLFSDYCVFGNAIIGSEKDSAKQVWIFGIVILLVVVLLVFTLLGVVRLEGDASAKQIIVSTLFRKKTFSTREIAGYYMSVYKSNKSSVVKYGRILVMKDGKKIELFYGNITYIDSIDQFMTDLSIPYMGEKDSNYPFSAMFNQAI